MDNTCCYGNKIPVAMVIKTGCYGNKHVAMVMKNVAIVMKTLALDLSSVCRHCKVSRHFVAHENLQHLKESIGVRFSCYHGNKDHLEFHFPNKVWML